MRVAITGARGRLGRAMIESLHARADVEALAWDRSAFNLDSSEAAGELVSATRPEVVVHTAAWTDVDGCALNPALAIKRNAHATRDLAEACAANGTSLILISTNEVFSGERQDRRGYSTGDVPEPGNVYGASKLAGERAATEAFAREGRSAGPELGIVRTAWLFGPGKPDFPARIVAAAREAESEGRPLRLVHDEIGTPTYAPDLADAIVRLLPRDFAGIRHIVNTGIASRAEWGRDVVARLGLSATCEDIELADFARPSRPPRWGVLEPTPIPGGPLRSWESAMEDRAAQLQGAP